jgi:hypothetical protein
MSNHFNFQENQNLKINEELIQKPDFSKKECDIISNQNYQTQNSSKNLENEIKNIGNLMIFNLEDKSNIILDNKTNTFENKYSQKKKKNQIKKNNKLNKPKRKKGDRYKELDNIRNNIKNRSFNFIISFFNIILNKILEKKEEKNEFLYINSKYKRIITQEKLSIQMNKTIEDFLQLDILDKYKNYEQNHNQILYNKIKEKIEKKYEYLFKMKLLDFYEKFFLNLNKEKIELEFGPIKKYYPLKDILPELRIKKGEEYAIKYEKTAKQLLQFANYKNINNRRYHKNYEGCCLETKIEEKKISESEEENCGLNEEKECSEIYFISKIEEEDNFKIIFNNELNEK